MQLPENSIAHIKTEIKNLDEGEIIIELNDTRKKIDIQTLSGDPSKLDSIIDDVRAVAKDIHHGKVIVQVIKKDGDKKEYIIRRVKRERFESSKKDEKKKKNT